MKHQRLFKISAVVSLVFCLAAILIPAGDINFRFPLPFPDSRVWPIEWNLGGDVIYSRINWAPPRPYFYFYMASWWAIWATAILPSWWILKRIEAALLALIARHFKPSGFCTICGYDLRATPDRCPECGTIPAKAIKVET